MRQNILIPEHFQCFSYILIIFMEFFGFEKMMCTLLGWAEGGLKSVCVCTLVNILTFLDNP